MKFPALSGVLSKKGQATVLSEPFDSYYSPAILYLINITIPFCEFGSLENILILL